ncbi:hypothetical protein C7N43_07360 [Sphingobacteriales bacterium UPWRP_1]|nr:hypothetical protein B6N25_05205 [Sphingobacteriales bacterium TSM_CSS]PSJ77691.1 hypothetical protein C7N43_07360 [Sphingobacteriales bacterium UPWRP_1]
MKQITGIIVLASACLCTQACTLTYRSIQPERLTYEENVYSSPDSAIKVSINYHVLAGCRNRMFSDIEKANKTNLVALKINNLSGRKLNMVEDFVILTNNNDTIQPLPLKTVIESFTVPLDNEMSDDDWLYRVGENTWETVDGVAILARVISGTKKTISQLRLANDLEYNYLESITIPPNSTEAGFLVLPVKRATPVKVKLKEQ